MVLSQYFHNKAVIAKLGNISTSQTFPRLRYSTGIFCVFVKLYILGSILQVKDYFSRLTGLSQVVEVLQNTMDFLSIKWISQKCSVFVYGINCYTTTLYLIIIK